MGRAVLRATGAAVALLTLAGAGCSDEAPSGAISLEAYEENVEAACAQHGQALQEASDAIVAGSRSTSELVAYFRTDWSPRIRSIIRVLNGDGFPTDLDYRGILSEVLNDLDELDADTFDFVTARTDGTLDEEDDYYTQVLDGLEEVGITCVP